MRLAAAAAIMALGVTSAVAADPPLYVDEEAIDLATPSVWHGFYAGIGATGGYGVLNGEYLGFGDIIAGFNVESNSFVFGAEAWLSAFATSFGSQGISGGAEVRAGYLVAPEALLYGSAGVSQFLIGGSQAYGQVGGGVEYALTDNMTLDLEYKYWWQLTGPQIHRAHSVSASALWHF